MSHVSGVGVDAVDVDRFRKVVERRPALVWRIFTDAEREDARGRRDPVERLAARFAAKEATMKALGRGLGSFAMRDVEVVRHKGAGPASAALRAGPPSLRLTAGAARVAAEQGVDRWHLSLAHTRQVAVAMVVGEAVE